MACPTCGVEAGCAHVRACPKCGTENPGSASECESCGVDMNRVLRFEESLARGRELSAREEYDDAIPHLEIAAAAYGKNPEAARLLKQAREKSKVVQQCRERIAADPDDADAILGILAVLPEDGPARQAALDLLPRVTVTDIGKAIELGRVLPEGEARRIAEDLAARKRRYDEAVAAAQRLLAAGDFKQALATVEPVLGEFAYAPAMDVKQTAEDRIRRPTTAPTASSSPRRALVWIVAAALTAVVVFLAWKIWG